MAVVQKRSYRAYLDEAQLVALAFVKLGLQPFHSVVVLSSNTAEANVATVGALLELMLYCSAVLTMPACMQVPSWAVVSPRLPLRRRRKKTSTLSRTRLKPTWWWWTTPSNCARSWPSGADCPSCELSCKRTARRIRAKPARCSCSRGRICCRECE